MQIKTLLTVGRISNLPTIWTNVLAAAVLGHESFTAVNIFTRQSLSLWLGTLFALSLMYLGGMFLNDAFDAPWDKSNGNLRPIVNGAISEKTVWIAGSVLLIAAVLTIAVLYEQAIPSQVATQLYQDFYGLLAGLSLALMIIVYNAFHKRFAHCAFIMGSCRSGVYLISALLLAELTMKVILAAISLLFYIAGLTYFARYEHANRFNRSWPLFLLFVPVIVAALSGYDSLYFWLFSVGFITWIGNRLQLIIRTEQPDVRKGIGGLLAAIPLLDGLMLASVNAVIPSLICLLIFLMIPRLHRWVSGT